MIGIQFLPAEKPAVNKNNPNDLIQNNDIPLPVIDLLKKSCYDCHSNETEYPWYAKVTPVNYLIYYDVEEGREKLNFSEWQSMKKIDRATALDEITEVISEGEMPVKIYTIMHRSAKLDKDKQNMMINWAEEFTEKLFE